ADAAGCSLANFDPPNNAVATTSSITLVGTSGGASNVLVNSIPATVANGMFRASVELPVEGPNAITITCADASGHATGTPQTISLQRVTGAPSVTIDVPAEMTPFGTATITASGTVNGATSVDVNGTAATITNTTWTAANVQLAGGMNVLVAR